MSWRLLTIRPSHYNEKARWALDYHGLAYDEEPWMPMFHFAGVVPISLPRRLGRPDRESTRFSTPLLLAGDQIFTDSSEILAFADEHSENPARALVWSTEVIELERQLSGRFGADTRRLAYYYLLDDDALLTRMAQQSVGPSQARIFELCIPVLRKGLRVRLAVDEEHSMRSRQRILDCFAEIDERLADGRPYLAGDRFSAADLSFAALAALALLVQPEEGYGAWLPALDEVNSDYAELVRRLRDTAAGQHALRCFAEHRGERALPCRYGRSA